MTTLLDEPKEPKQKQRCSESVLKRFFIRPWLWLWDGIKMPLVMFLLFWISGVGFYQGIVDGENVSRLVHGKALIITMVDLERDGEDEQ